MTRPIDMPQYRENRSFFASMGLADIAFFVLMVLVLTAPISTDTIGPDANGLDGQGNSIRQLAYLIIFGLTIYATGAYKTLRNWNFIPVELYLVLAICWLSLTWAIDPGVAIRRVVLLTIVAFSALLGIDHLGTEKVIRQLRIIFACVCVLNCLAVVVAPQIGIHQADALRDAAVVGDWRGIFPEKNYAGMVCALTILIFFLGPPLRSSWLRVFIILLAAAFLIQTNSKTSMALVGIALASAFAYKSYNHEDWAFALIGAASVALILTVAIMWNWEQLIAPLDQQDTLTGRSQIWRVVISYIADHPILGSGYGSFWNIGADSPVFQYERPGSWVQAIASGHNGYLDVAGQIGIPGLFLTAYLLLVRPMAALLAKPAFRGRMGSLFFATFVFIIGHNATESTLLDRDQLLNVMLLLTIGMINRLPLEKVPAR